MKTNSRRDFLKQTSLGFGAGILYTPTPSWSSEDPKHTGRISVATIDLKGFLPEKSYEAKINRVLGRM